MGSMFNHCTAMSNAAGQLLYQWQLAYQGHPNVIPGQNLALDGDVVWTKPSIGWVKANIDAAIFQNQGQIGAGCIVRDAASNMIIARTTNILGAYPVREAEALSLEEALSWLKERQIDKCILETDSAQIVEALNDSSK